MIAIKSITDLVEHPDPNQFPKNFDTAISALTKKISEVLDYLQRP